MKSRRSVIRGFATVSIASAVTATSLLSTPVLAVANEPVEAAAKAQAAESDLSNEIANRALSPTACKWRGTTTQFYTPPAKLPKKLGSIIRCRKVSIDNLAGTAYRIMYRTETPDGKKRASTGLVLVPKKSAPSSGRKVVAWSHGTVGLGPQCAPSRSTNAVNKSNAWINSMLRKNWVVTATDYAGLGLEGSRAGVQQYLIGKSGAIDTLNSVRAAGYLPQTQASKDYTVYGHSQGGQSALFAGKLAKSYLKSYSLKGVAAADPAGEVTAILDQVWSGAMGWAIGSEVAKSWPAANSALNPAAIVSREGLERYNNLADECIAWASTLAEINLDTHGPFFTGNPINNPQWAAFANQQNAPVVKGVPVFIGENTADGVVLPNTVALLQQKWCSAKGKKPTLRMHWMHGTAATPTAGALIHAQAAQAQSPSVIRWFDHRFAGKRAGSTCQTPPPVAPYGS